MTTEFLRKYGISIMFADVTDFAASGLGAPATAANDIRIGTTTGATAGQIDLTGVAASGGARESDKVDLGVTQTLKGHEWMVNACLEHETVAVDAETVDFYWASSPNSTAASGNPGGLTGSDAAVTDTVGGLGQIIYIGSITLRVSVINIGFVGIFVPPHRYGMLLVVNNSTKTLRSTSTAMDETHIIMTELIDEIQ